METMTPSTITDGQIDKAVDIFRAILRKHRSEFGTEAFQQTLGIPELGSELLAVVRKRVEAVNNIVVRHVAVNRARTPQQTLNATGRKQYTNSDVVATMPKGDGDETEVFFFKLGRYISDADLEKEYELRGLKPVDPYSLSSVNEADPAFADEHPNGTHWQDADGKWCYLAFDRWDDERDLDAYRNDDDWDVGWWFAGLRK